MNSVSIQGIKGSFHHIASQHYFGKNIKISECLSFDNTIDELINNKTDVAVIAIENSIAGSILPNYALIDDYQLHIIGEYYLDIQHHLMALPNQDIASIKEVYSHPMALLQCKMFFKDYPHIKLIEDKDTASVAQRISEKKLKKIGAIASDLAAKMFRLNILSHSIQTIKNNETRFVIVQQSYSKLNPSEINKASIKFELDHKEGSLAALLNVLSDCKINLTKIQSLPKIEIPWKYSFFVDITFNNYLDFDKAKSIIKIMANEFKVLGEYKNGKL